MGSIIRVENISHSYYMGNTTLPILFDINVEIPSGSFTALCGTSGSGKTTLLNLVGGLTRPSNGSIDIDNVDITKLSENQLCIFRKENIGFVFQSYNLLKYHTALENVELPLIFSGVPANERKERALSVLEMVGLADRSHHKPNELSGGQQQRVSIARALVNNPKLILADEPTGNLDSKTSVEIMDLLMKFNEESQCTFLMVTHSPAAAKSCKDVIYMQDGRIVSESEVIA